MNCLVGPGDSGKSSVLSAISLLLAPFPVGAPSEYDYFKRQIEEGFEIEGVIGLVDESALSSLRVPPLYRWLSGEIHPLPEGDGSDAVIIARVTGTPDFEIRHELLPPSGDPLPFSVGLRRKLLHSRLAGSDWAERELRLGRGSLLERHLGESPELKKALNDAVKTASSSFVPPTSTEDALERIRVLFREAALPADLMLAFVSPRGSSMLGMLGLFSGDDGESAIPLSQSGAGTRQMALYNLTVALTGASPIVLLDEPEVGLEPYRQRWLINRLKKLVGERGQAFITTHSPIVLRELAGENLWRLTATTSPASLAGDVIDEMLRFAPEAFLSRLPVICEGVTEVGLLHVLLNVLADKQKSSTLDSMGICLADGGSNEKAIRKGEKLCDAGITCGLFVDQEDTGSGLRARIAARAECAFHAWEDTKNIESALVKWLPVDQLGNLIELAASVNECNAVDFLQQVSTALGKQSRDDMPALILKYGEDTVRTALAQVMLKRSWFKSLDKGRRLGAWLIEIGVPTEIERQIQDYWERLIGKLE